jgi:septal ring factor EnvC (AmiA/AmiB activator)
MTDDELLRIAAELNDLDDELAAFERAENVSGQVTVLRQRARVWRRWADHLEQSGRDNHPAVLAAMRDTISADRLAEDGLL